MWARPIRPPSPSPWPPGRPGRLGGLGARRGHLHQAARVGGDQQLGAGGQHVRGLAVAELGRRLRVEQVVDAGRAAAELRLGDLPQLQPGDAAQQLARLGPDALGVGQVAGVVVGDGHRQRVPRAPPGRARPAARTRRGPAPRRPPARAAYAGSSASSSAYSFIDDPQPAALTTTRSTPAASKVSTSLRAKALRLRLAPVVHAQRAAAALPARDHHVAALQRQHPGGGRVDLREERALHAAGEQADDRPPGAAGGDPLGQRRGAAADRRRDVLHRRQRRRQPGQQAAAADQPLQPDRAGTPRSGPRSRAQPARVREQREDRLAQQPVLRRAGGAGARPGPGSPRSAGRTARPTGRPSRRPCSRGRRRSAAPSSRLSGSPDRPWFIR